MESAGNLPTDTARQNPPPPMQTLSPPPLNVTEVFEGSCILITGASGFLGKVLLEKLLFSQPNIQKIFLLVRPLRQQQANVRVQKLLESPIFNRVRCMDEKRFEKLVPVSGDLMEEQMGLSDEDKQTLADEVTIVFHCAATVKFDEALRVAIQMNVHGTQRLTALCRQMKKLKAFVHTSTAYANCNLAFTQECVYEPMVNADKLVKAASWMDTEMLDCISAKLLEGRPNTYTFAKALAESQLHKEQREHPLPIIIIRPSIIGAIWKEPLPGWIDNVNGPTGIIIGVGKGLLTDMCGDVNSNADIVPVDIVSNMLIVAAAKRAKMDFPTPMSDGEIPIIHCTSGVLNPIKWERIVIYLEQFFMAYPFDQYYRVPSTEFHRRRKVFLINFYFKHYAIAKTIDFLYRISGKEPKFVRIYNKIWHMMETLHYFTTRGWTFEAKNATNLWNSISEKDRKLYNFDIRKVDWDKYLFDYLMGVKLYLLKERLEDLPKSQANLYWLKQLYLYGNGIFFAVLIRLFAWRRSNRQKWMFWISGFLLTYTYQNYNSMFRTNVYLRSLEEYKNHSLPHYAEYNEKRNL